MEMYMVGGAVRDELLGVQSKDIDFTVVLDPWDIDRAMGKATPFEIMGQLLHERGFRIFLETPEFLTIRAKFPKGHEHSGLTADFVLARKESDYTDGRRPDVVKPGTLMDDIFRRDFTMNALAKDTNGTIIDLVGGVKDINDRIIRAVGNPRERFEEDALRIMRAMRFTITKDFSIEEATRAAMWDLKDSVASVSSERVREELTKMFNHDPLRTIWILDQFDMFHTIFDMGINLQPTLKEKIR